MTQDLLLSLSCMSSDKVLCLVKSDLHFLTVTPPSYISLTESRLADLVLVLLLIGVVTLSVVWIAKLKRELRSMKMEKQQSDRLLQLSECRSRGLSYFTEEEREVVNGSPVTIPVELDGMSNTAKPFSVVIPSDEKGNGMPEIQSVGTSRDEDFSRHVRMMIEENILNPEFRIDDLSEAVCMSRTTFYRKVKTLFGVSPKDLVLQIRMKYALELMKNRDLTLAEVSFKAGFASPQYFNRVFKEQQHCTPKEYRQRAMGA